MNIIDITHSLNSELYVYPDDPQVVLQPYTTIKQSGYNVTKISLGTHSGSHVDAPSHVLEGGKQVSEICLDNFIGSCTMKSLDDYDFAEPLTEKRVLFRTNSYKTDCLTKEQAGKLVESNIQLIGTDSISIGDSSVHKTLLAAGCIVLEYLDLSSVPVGDYILCALPLKISADGAPVRACLINKHSRDHVWQD